MPMIGREPAVRSRVDPTGQPISYPVCSDWTCDDEEDWETVGPGDEDYAAVKRERDIVYYHEPRDKWRERLYEERDRLSGGDPLWCGKPR